MDPLAEKYYAFSPYAYCGNNPVRFVDPDGKKIVIGTFWQRLWHFLGFESEYITKVSEQLKQNNEDSEYIASVYKQLEDSELEFYILPLSNNDIGNYVIPEESLTPGKKQGGTMYYDPYMTTPLKGYTRDPRIALAHELGHFEDLMNGTIIHYNSEKAKKGDKAEQKKWEQNEQNAMMLENIIRQVLGDEKRKTYFYQQEEKQEEK